MEFIGNFSCCNVLMVLGGSCEFILYLFGCEGIFRERFEGGVFRDSFKWVVFYC